MNQFDQFQNALLLETTSSNTFRVTPDDRYFVGKTPHGGYLNALMHKALVSSVPHSAAISSSIQYLDRIEAKDFILEVEVFKVSRGSSSGLVRLIQDDRICTVFNAICSDFDHMKGYNGLETRLPDIFKDVSRDKYKSLNYDNTPSFIHQLGFTVHPNHAWWDRDINEAEAEARCSSYMQMHGGIPDPFVLSFSAILIAIVIGLFFGIISALNKGNYIDIFIQFISTIGMSVPSFFSAIIFAWIFGFLLKDLTGLEMTGSLFELDDYGESFNLKLKNLILPSIVLGIRPLAVISQLVRNELLHVLNQDYIRTARAKGLSQIEIIKNHALKNALNPVVTVISGWFASLLAGAVFVEFIFGWNGIGKEIVNALNLLDLPVIMVAVLVIAFVFIIINILVDIIYIKLDPRIKIN